MTIFSMRIEGESQVPVSPKTESAQFTRDWYMWGRNGALVRQQIRVYEFERTLRQAFLYGDAAWR